MAKAASAAGAKGERLRQVYSFRRELLVSGVWWLSEGFRLHGFYGRLAYAVWYTRYRALIWEAALV